MNVAHHFIAEIGTSHGGDLTHAKELISASVDAGATIIKFQWVIADEIVPPHVGHIDLPQGSTDIYQSFKDLEQNIDFYLQLKQYTEQHRVEFLCSIFGLESLSLLVSLKPHYLKIASPEVNHYTLLKRIQYSYSTENPFTLIISDGVSSYMDIQRVCNYCPSIPIVILRCITQYPAPVEKYQLSRMSMYAQLFNCPIGISDHSTDPCILPVLASKLGSQYTEKHITLSRNNKGLDDSYALLPHEFATMVKEVLASLQSTYANHYEYTPQEQDIIKSEGQSPTLMPIYYTTRRSIFSNTAIPQGDTIRQDNITMLRSETNIDNGISAEYFPFIEGYPIQTKIPKSHPITWDMLL